MIYMANLRSNRDGTNSRWYGRVAECSVARCFVIGLLCAVCQPQICQAQVQIQAEEQALQPAEKPADTPKPTTTRSRSSDEKTIKENEEKYAGGAALKTDSDLEDELKKATAFVAEKNYRFATILWDRVLEKSNNSLVTRDGETYISLVREVEETIRSLPPNGLKVYRISADGKAKALMPGSPADADDESLRKLVRLYFMSSIGDEAAFELGCRALDSRDFVTASRLFNKVLDEHPDPTVDRNEILIRQAIAAGNLGDRDAAKKALETAVVEDSSRQALLVNTQKHLEYLTQNSRSVSESGESISMRLSNSDRTGVMPNLPDDAVNGDLTQGYEFRFPFVFSNNKAESDLGKVIRGGSTGDKTVDPTISSLSQKWKTEKWFPTNQLLYADGRLVLKTTNDLVCIDASGKSDLALWHSLWLNVFELDEASWNVKNYSSTSQSRSGQKLPMSFPNDAKESWYFFDRIRQSMAIHRGVVYTIEGKNYSQLDDSVPANRRATTSRSYNQPVNLTRSRTNNLTAYDLKTGKVLWTRSAFDKEETPGEEEDTSTASKTGFLGTPVPFGNLVICPVTEGGAISICGMDTTQKGKTVWKTFLCDDPSEGVDHFASVEVTIAGQDAYVTCGTGVVFSLNAASGNVQFARRYTRDGTKRRIQTSYNQYQEMLLPEGWEDNVVVTWNNALIVMAADHDYVFAIDRRNGKFLWDAPRLPFDEDVKHAYCLGHFENKLIMATNKGILCYNLAGDGKLHWYQKFGGNSYGKGFITSRAVYVPVEDSIVKFDLESGKKLAQVGVNLGSESKVGNLYSDGKQIWVAGMNRVVALRSLRDRLAELDSQISQGDEEALRERLAIYSRLNEHEKALGDAVKLFELSEDKAAGFQSFVKNLEETKVLSSVAPSVLAYLNQLLGDEESRKKLQPLITTEYKVFFDAADASAAAGDNKTAEMVLGWSSLGISSGFNSAVTKFLASNPPSLEQLKQALENAGEQQQGLLIPVLAKVNNSNSLLASLLTAESERVQIAAANELAILGDKACLQPALKLLSSGDKTLRREAFLILKNVTSAKIKFPVEGNDADRESAIAEWKKWLDENQETFSIKMPVELRFGKVLVATSKKIIEFDLENNMSKDQELEGYEPIDLVTARNGNRVVAEYTRKRVVELDSSKKPVKTTTTQFGPYSARKLANGNLLVTWRSQSKPVVELDSSGKVVWEVKKLTGYAYSAQRLKNGNTLIAFQTRVVEVDPESNVIYEIGRAQAVSNCQEAKRLANGNTMIVHGTNVSVFDKNKNAVLRIRGGFSPKSAVQLRDGRILVAHATGLRVFDKEGNKVGDDLVNENVNSVWDY